ncbi:MAG TPA: carboxypeptidase-like regulatory domain-containing protein [Thermoanaerobaculia bacterium]|nr:carboxypeptidase-like regulatory domain-containing protein [Thermoanaerobaculia bacterium]
MRAAAFLILLLAFPALAAPIPVGGQVSPVVKGAQALLIPLVSEIEAGRLELEGRADPEPVASAAVAADGSFRLEAPEPGMYRVLVQAPGFVPREKQLTPLLEETDLPAVEMEKDARVEVRITGADGKPVQGARVRIGDRSVSVFRDMDSAKWRLPARAGLTDAQGRVVLPRDSSESLLVRAGAPGLPFVERRDVRTSTVALALAVGSTRDLRVLDAAGKPVPGALVRLGEARWAAGRTGADGILAVPFAGKLKLQVLAVAEDGRSATLYLEPSYLEPKKPEETGPRDLRLPPVETLSGRVVSTVSGSPVAGALVWAADPGAFRRTGADGVYKLSAVPGRELSITATAAGFFQRRSNWPVKAGERRAPTLALEPAFTAAGVVVDEQGKPVAGVEIKARIQPGSRAMDRWESGGNARTSAAGRFRIPRLAGGIAHQLRLTRQGYAPATADVPPVEPGTPASDLRIVLRKGRTAFGRVVDPADRPVAGAGVVLEPEPPGDMMMIQIGPDDDSVPFEAVADATGRFELRDLPPGTFKLTARGSGFAPTAVPGLSIPAGAGSTDLGTVTLVRGVALEGYVTGPDGRPIEGAQVSVAEATGDPIAALARGEEPPAAVTSLDGFFRVEDRRSGETVDVEVRRSGYAKGSAPGVQVPSEEPVRIVLLPSSAVEGRTVDPDGKPVPGARIVLDPMGPTAMSRGRAVFTVEAMKHALSGDDGSFRIEDVPPGTFELMALAAGRQPANMTSLEVRSGQDLRGVEVVLRPGAVLEGRVLAPGGRPIPGARVSLVETGSIGTMRAGWARTDGDGRYRLDAVPPGTRLFRADSEGFRERVRELEVRAGENGLDFELEGGAEVTGRVVDDDGVPVPAAAVVLHEGGGSWNLPNAVSRPDGSFTLTGVADGTYRIAAEKEGFALTQGQELTVAGNVSGVEIRLSTGGAIVGQLTGLDFAELSQAQVWLDDEFLQGRVFPDSSYRIENVEPGEHRVLASLRGERQTDGRVTLEPGEREARLDLELADGYLLTGRVLRNGQVVRGENVALGGPGVAGRWAKTDHEGRFRFEGLEAGTYDLTVIDSRGQSHHKETVELSRDAEVELELVAVTLAGRVLDSSDKQPLSGVRVTLLPPRGGEVASGSFLQLDAATDSRGVFRLPGVPGGSWRVQAVLEGYTPGEQSIEVDAGSAEEELEIALQATEGVTLQVVLASGRAPSYVRTAVLDPAGQVIASGTYPTADDGRLRVAIVPPGSWDLVLDADGAAPVTLSVTSPGHAGRVVLPLPGVLDLKVPALLTAPIGARVTLTDQNGNPFHTPYGGSLTAFDLEAGALKLQRIAPGTWKLDVAADDGRTWSGTATIVPGGTVTITLD